MANGSDRLEFLLQGFPILLHTSVTPNSTENEAAEIDRQDVIRDMNILYKFFGRVKEHDKFRSKFGELVKQIGSEMVCFRCKDDDFDCEINNQFL